MEEARCRAHFLALFTPMLTIEGNVPRLRARSAHFVSHLPRDKRRTESWRDPYYCIPPFSLLPCHDRAQLGFSVPDQVATDIHRYAVDLAGKLERRRVLRRDWQAGIGAAGQTTWVEDDWRGDREFGRSNQFAIDVEQASPRRRSEDTRLNSSHVAI